MWVEDGKGLARFISPISRPSKSLLFVFLGDLGIQCIIIVFRMSPAGSSLIAILSSLIVAGVSLILVSSTSLRGEP